MLRLVVLRLMPILGITVIISISIALTFGRSNNGDILMYIGPEFLEMRGNSGTFIFDQKTGIVITLLDPSFEHRDSAVLHIVSVPIWIDSDHRYMFKGKFSTHSMYNFSPYTRQITPITSWHGHDPRTIVNFNVSPNGEFVSYIIQKSHEDSISGDPDQSPIQFELYLLNRKTGELNTISTLLSANNTLPIWAQDSSHFVFSSQDENGNPNFDEIQWKIHHINTGISNPIEKPTNVDHLWALHWSPDGEMLFFIERYDTTNIRLIALNISTAEWSEIHNLDANWRIVDSAFVGDSDDQILLITQSTDAYGEHITQFDVLNYLNGDYDTLLSLAGVWGKLSWAPSGQFFTVEGDDCPGYCKKILIIDATTGEEVHRVEG